MPRTGKTTSVSYLPRAFEQASLTYVAPTFGHEGDVDSGALMAARQAFLAQGVPWGFSPGKAKGCEPFATGAGPRTPSRREHALLCAERCSAEACDRIKDLSKVMELVAHSPGPSIPTLPGKEAYQGGMCPQKAGWADLLAARPGTAIGTSPQGLWNATKHLGRKGFPTMAEWAANRIVVIDEAHKDDLFFQVGCPEIVCSGARGTPALPNAIADWRLDADARAFGLLWDLEKREPSDSASHLFGALALWTSRTLAMGIALDERFQSLHAANGPLAVLARIHKRLSNKNHATRIAHDIRTWLQDGTLLSADWRSRPAAPGAPGQPDMTFGALLEETAATLEELGARPVTPAEAHALAKRHGLVSFLLTWRFDNFDQYRRFLQPFHEGATSVLQPWAHRDSCLAEFVQKFLAHLDARGSRSPWVSVLEALEMARGDCVVLPRIETNRGVPLLKLNVLHADLDLEESGAMDDFHRPPIRPHFGPLQEFVANGGTLLLLSGTPQSMEELQRALGGQVYIRIVEDLAEKPRPTLTIHYDQATSGERDWWDGDALTTHGRDALDAIQAAFGLDKPPHLVGAGLKDREGLVQWARATGFPEDRIEHARSRASLATRWAPGAIVWLRPPRLPPDHQPVLAGLGCWESGSAPDLAEVSEHHRTLRMAQEFFQTSLRTADAFAEAPGSVVLLSAGRDVPALQDFAKRWGLPVVWKRGPSKHSAGLAERATQLCLAAQGRHPQQWMGELESRLGAPRTKHELVTFTGWPSHTVNRRVNELMVAGKVRRVGRQPGRNGADLWLWVDE